MRGFPSLLRGSRTREPEGTPNPPPKGVGNHPLTFGGFLVENPQRANTSVAKGDTPEYIPPYGGM